MNRQCVLGVRYRLNRDDRRRYRLFFNIKNVRTTPWPLLPRSTDAAGAAGLILTGSTADPHHPRSVRASMGSMFRLPVERMELQAATSRLRAEHLTLIGTRVAGGEDYRDAPLRGPCALFFGAEGAGLDESFLTNMDHTVTIPLYAEVESLSVGAAVAVTLFEAVRQRRPWG